jgi:predicted  nucleic acid-binding Zn-ribbon protein
MHPDLAKLIELQALDNELRAEHDHIAALAKSLAAAESSAKAAEAQLSQLRESIAKEEALRRREESDIADLRQKLDRAQKKIDNATTTAQVTALEHEITFLKSEISRLEDQELESMERSETLETQQATAQQTASNAAAALGHERTRSADETAAAHATIASVESHRTALIDNSPESPASQSLMTCENCGRLLYYDPSRDAPQRKPATPERNESIAAQIVRNSI